MKAVGQPDPGNNAQHGDRGLLLKLKIFVWSLEEL